MSTIVDVHVTVDCTQSTKHVRLSNNNVCMSQNRIIPN